MGLQEAYHSYHHLCENSEAEKLGPCHAIIERHHFHCNHTVLTEVQRLWLNMHREIVKPAIFLIVAEYMPLLLVLLLMIPVAKNASALQQLAAAVYRTRTWILTTPRCYQMMHSMDFGPHKSIKWPARITFGGSVFLFVLMFFRFGVLVNALGRYPHMEWMSEAVAQMASSTTMSILFVFCNWKWLGDVRVKWHSMVSRGEKVVHQLTHARLDSLLLKVSSYIIT